MAYNPNNAPSERYHRAVTKKIITRSIAKNAAIKKALEAETELNRAKWQALLSELAYLPADSEREIRAREMFTDWLQGRNKEKAALRPKKNKKTS